jgi:pyrroline-5-carboxylate reductase
MSKKEKDGVKKLAVIGMGNMGQALVKGVLDSGFIKRENIHGIEVDAEKAASVKADLKIEVLSDYGILEECDAVIIAVKPQSMKDLLPEISPFIKRQVIISIAAGITAGFLKNGLGDRKIVRCMPNTPSLAGRGITGIYCTDKVDRKEKMFIEGIFNAVGVALFVEKEDDIDRITALSGSGPAYVYYFMEAMEDAGVMIGLSRDAAKKLVLATFEGSTALIGKTGRTPTELKQMVTSPAGTTVHGLHALEKGGVKGVIYDAIMAAFKRSRDLGI